MRPRYSHGTVRQVYVCICHYQVDRHKHKSENNTELRHSCLNAENQASTKLLIQDIDVVLVVKFHVDTNFRTNVLLLFKKQSLIIKHLKNSLLYGLQTLLTKTFLCCAHVMCAERERQGRKA